MFAKEIEYVKYSRLEHIRNLEHLLINIEIKRLHKMKKILSEDHLAVFHQEELVNLLQKLYSESVAW